MAHHQGVIVQERPQRTQTIMTTIGHGVYASQWHGRWVASSYVGFRKTAAHSGFTVFRFILLCPCKLDRVANPGAPSRVPIRKHRSLAAMVIEELLCLRHHAVSR